NTATFSLINAALLRMLPVPTPERLVFFTVAGQRGVDESFSYPLYEQFRGRTRSFSGIFASGGGSRMRMVVREPGGGGQNESVQTEKVSGNFFSVLGVTAIRGRTLTDEDDRPGAPRPVAVISYGFWQRRFGLDPAVVGKNIVLNDVPFTIVGITPPGFFGFEVGKNPDLWWPLQMLPQIYPGNQNLNQPGSTWLRLMGRLRPEGGRPRPRLSWMTSFSRRWLSGRRREPPGWGPRGQKLSGATSWTAESRYDRGARDGPYCANSSGNRCSFSWPWSVWYCLLLAPMSPICFWHVRRRGKKKSRRGWL